jgi:hypothetical protein
MQNQKSDSYIGMFAHIFTRTLSYEGASKKLIGQFKAKQREFRKNWPDENGEREALRL